MGIKERLSGNEAVATAMRQINPERMYSFKSGNVRFESEVEIPWTLDGEFGGEHSDVLIRNQKQALQIMVKNENEVEPAKIEAKGGNAEAARS